MSIPSETLCFNGFYNIYINSHSQFYLFVRYTHVSLVSSISYNNSFQLPLSSIYYLHLSFMLSRYTSLSLIFIAVLRNIYTYIMILFLIIFWCSLDTAKIGTFAKWEIGVYAPVKLSTGVYSVAKYVQCTGVVSRFRISTFSVLWF